MVGRWFQRTRPFFISEKKPFPWLVLSLKTRYNKVLLHPFTNFFAQGDAAMEEQTVSHTAYEAGTYDIAVIGVDNDELFCNTAAVPLSSILPDHESLGHTAARELGRLLRGGSPKDVTISNPVREIFERDSTNIVPPAEHLIRKAKAYIPSHASESITPKDVVRYLGVSRSLAGLRFRELNGSSIRKEIAVARIGMIKRRLTSLISAERACI